MVIPAWLWSLFTLVLIVVTLFVGKALLMPLALAILLSFLLSPVCSWMERWGLGRVPAVFMTAFMGFSLLGLLAWVVVVQLTSLSPKILEYQRNIEAKLSTVNQYAVTVLHKLSETTEGFEQGTTSSTSSVEEPRGTTKLPYAVRVLTTPSSPWQIFGGMYSNLLEVMGTIGVIIVLVVFFLVRRDDLRDRFIHLTGKKQVTVTTLTLEDAGTRVSRYLSTLLMINFVFGVSVGVGLCLIGIPNFLLWGILAMTLRFLPYIGPWIAASMPIALSMAISTGWIAPILTIGLFVVLELLNNNLIEPWIYGRNTGVSAVAVLIAAFFWMWLWGPVGLLLATPLTVCILVVGKHVPGLSFLDILLGSEPVFEPKERVYQRLLAGDQEEVAELLEEYLEKMPLVQVYDSILIPALIQVETHWQLGDLNDNKHEFILQCFRDLVQYQGERPKLASIPLINDSEQANSPTEISEIGRSTVGISVLCIPAKTEADEITALMLKQVLGNRLGRVDVLASTVLQKEIIEVIERTKPDVIYISATPPAATMHARIRGKQLREQAYTKEIIVGLWSLQSDLSRSQERIGSDATVIAGLADAEGSARLISRLSSQVKNLPSKQSLIYSDDEKESLLVSHQR
jgi:predicted PurR-regulated permease PerM